MSCLKVLPTKFVYKSYIFNICVNNLQLLEMDTLTRVPILDEADCISHYTNTLGKGLNPIILPVAMGK